MAYGPVWENTRPRGMDGLLIRKLGRCAATDPSREDRFHPLVSSIGTARHSCYPHKKGAGFALTRLATLRHNNLVRECVHGERVLAQPMTSERRLPSFVLQRNLRDHR